MLQRHCRRVVGLLLVSAAGVLPAIVNAAADSPAAAEVRASGARSASDLWFTLAFGAYQAKDYPAAPQSTPGGTRVGGGEGAMSLSYAWLDSGVLLRLRSAYLIDFTSNTAEEVALSTGLALSAARNTWLTVGVSRLTDVSNTRQSPTLGLPVELLYYPLRGLELGVHGNLNDDRSFIGVSVGWAIGHRRSG